MSRAHSWPGRPLAALVAAVVIAAIAAISTNSALARTGSSLPPNGVYTCDWIAAHPAAAAQAGVTCDPSIFFAAASARPAAGGPPITPLSQGCVYLPSSPTRAGQGVFAWSSYQYSTYWGWYGIYSPADYTWYVQTSGGTYAYGNVYDTNSYYLGVPANIYRWGAQNHSSTAQQWFVCWNDN